jgi:hypothetical protein
MQSSGEEWWPRRLELQRERVLVQEKPKVRQGMDAAADCEAPDAFYRVEEGGETMSWRRNGRQRVEFFNASVLGRRDEGTSPVSKGEMNRWGNSWFPRGGVTRECSNSRHPEFGGIWIDPRWKTISRVSWADRLFGPDIVVRSNRLSKWNGLGKRDSWAGRKLWRRI